MGKKGCKLMIILFSVLCVRSALKLLKQMWFGVLWALECVVVWVLMVGCSEDVGSKFMRNVGKYLSKPDMEKDRVLPNHFTDLPDCRVPQLNYSLNFNGFGFRPPIKQAPLKRFRTATVRECTRFCLHSTDSSRRY
jgi:hypothetical protein